MKKVILLLLVISSSTFAANSKGNSDIGSSTGGTIKACKADGTVANFTITNKHVTLVEAGKTEVYPVTSGKIANKADLAQASKEMGVDLTAYMEAELEIPAKSGDFASFKLIQTKAGLTKILVAGVVGYSTGNCQ